MRSRRRRDAAADDLSVELGGRLEARRRAGGHREPFGRQGWRCTREPRGGRADGTVFPAMGGCGHDLEECSGAGVGARRSRSLLFK